MSSAQVVASVDDLLTEILLRLPIKSLLRYKLVSKHWHSLITNPQFRLLRNPNPNPPLGLFLRSFGDFRISYQYLPFSVNESNNPPPFKVLKLAQEPPGVYILQSCNGLLLCCSTVRLCNQRYYVYNPTTNIFSILPKLDAVGESTRMCGLNLAFDPTKSPHHKVVCIWRSELDSGEYVYRFEVYSSDTGHWSVLFVEQLRAQFDFINGVYWNGAIHWMSIGAADSLYCNLDGLQVLEKMPMPPIPNGLDRRSNSYFGECCGHLHYAQYLGPLIELKVYEMKRDYSGWFVKYRVDLSPVVVDYPGMISEYRYEVSVFSMVRGEREEDDSFLVFQIPGKLVRYNLVSRTFELMHESECRLYTHGFKYIQSLCSV